LKCGSLLRFLQALSFLRWACFCNLLCVFFGVGYPRDKISSFLRFLLCSRLIQPIAKVSRLLLSPVCSATTKEQIQRRTKKKNKDDFCRLPLHKSIVKSQVGYSNGMISEPRPITPAPDIPSSHQRSRTRQIHPRYRLLASSDLSNWPGVHLAASLGPAHTSRQYPITTRERRIAARDNTDLLRVPLEEDHGDCCAGYIGHDR